MSDTVVNVYLIVVTLGGLSGTVVGLIVGLRKTSNKMPVRPKWKIFLRGLMTFTIGCFFLALFTNEKIGRWTAFLSVALLLIIQEYFLHFLGNRLAGSGSSAK